MPLLKERPWYAAANSQRITTVCFIVIAVIATAESFIVPVMGLGFLYVIPLAIAAAFLSPWQIMILSAICSAFWEGLTKVPYTEAWPLRVLLLFCAYTFASLLVRNMVEFRRAASRRIAELEGEVTLLADVARNSDLLLNAIPAGVITVSAEGKIMQCNCAAHEMLSVAPGGLSGHPVVEFLPEFERTALPSGPSQSNTLVRRASGEKSLRIWVSTSSADRTIIVVLDAPSVDRVGGKD